MCGVIPTNNLQYYGCVDIHSDGYIQGEGILYGRGGGGYPQVA